MFKKVGGRASRERRRLRIHRRISGIPERPKLPVCRSGKSIYAQVTDGVNSVTSASTSSLDKAFDTKAGENREAAKMVDKLVAKEVLEKGISEVIFDRGGYVYHGKVQTLAEAARETGLKF